MKSNYQLNVLMCFLTKYQLDRSNSQSSVLMLVIKSWHFGQSAKCFFLCAFFFSQGNYVRSGASQVELEVNYLACQCKRHKIWVMILESGRFPGGGNDNPLQYPCLKTLMDRGAWWAIADRVTKSQTWLRTHTHVSSKIDQFYFYFYLLSSYLLSLW